MGVENAIILAGGLGERLRPLTSDRPKPMIEIAGYPLLYHSIQWLKRAGVKTVVISCGYHHEVIREYFQDGLSLGLEILYSIEEHPLGRGGGIRLAGQLLAPHMREPVLVMNGDMLTDLSLRDLFDYHLSSRAEVTMVTVALRSPYGIVECNSANYVTKFAEKPILPYWINAGIYILNQQLLSEFPEEGDHEESLFPKLAQENKLRAYHYTGFWRTIDTAKDLTDLCREFDTLSKKES